MPSQIISVSTVNSTVCSGRDQRKHQSSTSVALVRGIHRWPMDSPHRGPIMRKVFPFNDIIMSLHHYAVLLQSAELPQLELHLQWTQQPTSHFSSLPPLDKMATSLADIFKCIFLNGNDRIPIRISMRFVPRSPIDNKPVLVQVMAWRRTGDKPLPELVQTQYTGAYMLH